MAMTLTRESVGGVKGQRHVWPLRVTLSQDDNEDPDLRVPHKIFVYHVAPPFAGDGKPVFEAVASVSQVSEIPEDAPILAPVNGEVVPYYRTNVMEFDCRSLAEADDLWKEIKAEVSEFLTNWNSWKNLAADEEVALDPDAFSGTVWPPMFIEDGQLIMFDDSNL
jgi:hypothetical protein